MNLVITPKPLKGAVTPPPSKSLAHRALLAAFLAGETAPLPDLPDSQDILATRQCLAALREGKPMDCRESGSTLRFLIPVSLALRHKGVFTGRGRLMERPQTPYFNIFKEKNIAYTQENGVLTVKGALPPGDYRLPGGVSSQFVTGLLFALPLVEGDSELILTSPLESRGYVDLTLDVLEQFGISLENQNYERFLVSGRQRYQPCAYSVEADWSQAAFWYAANFVGCQVTLEGLNFDSAQGDKQAAALYWPMARPGDLDIDLAHIPDLAPPLAAMAAVRRGVTRFVHAGRLRLKESDRIAAITDALNALGAQAEETPDGFVVHGMPQLEGGGTVDCRNDHRIAMMAGVLACCAQRPSTLLGAECVKILPPILGGVCPVRRRQPCPRTGVTVCISVFSASPTPRPSG